MFRSLRVRNYRLYAGGQLVSLTGTWMQRIAQDWLVLELTNSGTALGVVTALQFAPSLLFGMWGGVLADRADKRRLLMATQAVMVVLSVLLGLLDVGGVVQYWQVLVIALVFGLVTAVDTPVRQTFAVEMVGPRELANAVAIESTVFNIGRILGPAIAGVMIAVVGTGWVFLADAASGVAVLVALGAMRSADLLPAARVLRARGQLRDGLCYVRGRRDLMLTMALIFVVSVFGLNFAITCALLAKQVFHRGAAGYGVFTTALALGAFAGAVTAARRTRRPSSWFLIGAAGAFGAVEAVAGLMPSYAWTAVALVPAGFAMLTINTAANANVQLGVDPTMRGRVMALYLMCFLGGTPIGAPLVGWAAGVFGPRAGLVGGGLACLVCAALLAVPLAQHHGRLPRPGVVGWRRAPRRARAR